MYYKPRYMVEILVLLWVSRLIFFVFFYMFEVGFAFIKMV